MHNMIIICKKIVSLHISIDRQWNLKKLMDDFYPLKLCNTMDTFKIIGTIIMKIYIYE